MSLEYAIEYKCEMRREWDEPTLRVLGRTGSLISRVIHESLQASGVPSEESVQFTTRFAEEIERAEQVAEYCRTHCAACLDSEEVSSSEQIGCLGRITYPIEARFERFVADRLQLLYDTMPPDEWPHLMHILADAESPFDGEASKELRRITTADGLRFFELRAPIELSRKSARLTSDHIFDLLSGFSATDGGASGYQRELPAMALTDYGDFLEALLVNDLEESEMERLQKSGVNYAQYLRFTRAVRRAEALGVRLLMD
jgi:hypothetical protein